MNSSISKNQTHNILLQKYNISLFHHIVFGCLNDKTRNNKMNQKYKKQMDKNYNCRKVTQALLSLQSHHSPGNGGISHTCSIIYVEV